MVSFKDFCAVELLKLLTAVAKLPIFYFLEVCRLLVIEHVDENTPEETSKAAIVTFYNTLREEDEKVADHRAVGRACFQVPRCKECGEICGSVLRECGHMICVACLARIELPCKICGKISTEFFTLATPFSPSSRVERKSGNLLLTVPSSGASSVQQTLHEFGLATPCSPAAAKRDILALLQRFGVPNIDVNDAMIVQEKKLDDFNKAHKKKKEKVSVALNPDGTPLCDKCLSPAKWGLKQCKHLSCATCIEKKNGNRHCSVCGVQIDSVIILGV